MTLYDAISYKGTGTTISSSLKSITTTVNSIKFSDTFFKKYSIFAFTSQNYDSNIIKIEANVDDVQSLGLSGGKIRSIKIVEIGSSYSTPEQNDAVYLYDSSSFKGMWKQLNSSISEIKSDTDFNGTTASIRISDSFLKNNSITIFSEKDFAGDSKRIGSNLLDLSTLSFKKIASIKILGKSDAGYEPYIDTAIKQTSSDTIASDTKSTNKIKLIATLKDGAILLEWSNLVNPNIVGYNLYKRVGTNKLSGQPLGNTLFKSQSYKDTDVLVSSDYYYICKAIDSVGGIVFESDVVAVKSAASRGIESTNKDGSSISLNNTDKKNRIVLKVDDSKMTVNGEKKDIDSKTSAKPVIIDNRVLLPIRGLIEVIGGTIAWDPSSRKVTIVLNGNTITLFIDSPKALVNGTEKEVSPAPRIIDSRTFIPLRFVIESLGEYNIEWDQNTKSVSLSY
jgi:hypothetical protein